MAKVLKNIFNAGTDEIKQSFTIESWHVSQSVDALTGVQDYDITISGSLTLTGSTNITGSTVINGGVGPKALPKPLAPVMLLVQLTPLMPNLSK